MTFILHFVFYSIDCGLSVVLLKILGKYSIYFDTGNLSQESANKALPPVRCDLVQVDDEEAGECRGLPKADSYDSLQFLVPLEQDDIDSDSGDEAYSVPLSMRRPRSDSGSRYLTDDVRYSASFVYFTKT